MVANNNFDVPEFNRIGALMSDLLYVDGPARAAAPAPRPATPAANRRPMRLGGTPLGAFLDAVNWSNTPGYRSPLVAPTGPRLGALTLAAFAAGVNWGNTPDGPRLAVVPTGTPQDKPPLTLDSFLDEFQWD